MCSIEVNLDGGGGGQIVLGRAPDGLVLTSVSAELWHRRMRHINHKSLDVLRKEPASGVDYTGDLKNCGPAHSGRTHNNRTPSGPPAMFYVLSRSYSSTPSAPSRLNIWAGINTP